jgi:inosine-uridine nucleoside N-ribohydrolase
MVGLDVTHRTLFGQNHLAELKKTRGVQNDLASRVMAFLVDLSAKFGAKGTPMHDPLAVGVAVDPTLVTLRDMRVDVETRGEYTRGMTVGNRNGFVERNVEKDDRLVMVGIDPVKPNARVAVEVDAERFLTLFIDRLRGR